MIYGNLNRCPTSRSRRRQKGGASDPERRAIAVAPSLPRYEEEIMYKSILVSLAFAVSVGAVHAQEPASVKEKITVSPGQVRTILTKTDLDGCLGKEAVVLTVDGKPMLVGKKHFHPGDEFIYLAEGTLILDVAGKGKVTLKKGETLHIPGRVVHQAMNPDSEKPFKAVTFGVFEKGQPDTTVVAE
jgi:quercetin dioxygenase-like cupin family protein